MPGKKRHFKDINNDREVRMVPLWILGVVFYSAICSHFTRKCNLILEQQKYARKWSNNLVKNKSKASLHK